MKTLSRSLHKLLKPLASAQGFADARILSSWRQIVGDEFYQHAQPQQLKNGVLTVSVCHGAVAMQLQHMAPMIIERINRYFGFAAVKGIRPQQTYFDIEPPKTRTNIVPDVGAETRAEAQVQEVKDDSLREALKKLGAQVESRHSKPTT